MPKRAKDYGNVVHLNLFSENADDELILTKVPPPELHLLIGPVNKMFDELCKIWPHCEDVWMKPLRIKREEYHGDSFNENDCRKLLKNVDILDQSCPSDFRGYVNAFNAFNEVVHLCYDTNLFDN